MVAAACKALRLTREEITRRPEWLMADIKRTLRLPVRFVRRSADPSRTIRSIHTGQAGLLISSLISCERGPATRTSVVPGHIARHHTMGVAPRLSR